MTEEQINRLIDAISNLDKGNDLWTLLLIVLFSGVGAFFGSYLKRKGENVATKEDISDITSTVESIKSKLETKKELRLAALDRRLAAHQEAFTLWRDLVSHIHKDDCYEHVSKCQDWWNENCLYLDAESRQAFRISYLASHSHPDYVTSGHPETITENWKIVIAAGEKIVAGAALPSLGTAEEAEQITEDPTNQDSQ
jgi:hypothetical protein